MEYKELKKNDPEHDPSQKDTIQKDPVLYNDELHRHLFTPEELINLSQSLRG